MCLSVTSVDIRMILILDRLRFFLYCIECFYIEYDSNLIFTFLSSIKTRDSCMLHHTFVH